MSCYKIFKIKSIKTTEKLHLNTVHVKVKGQNKHGLMLKIHKIHSECK